MKKLLLITFLLLFTFSFAQQKEKDSSVIKKNEPTTTLLSVSASPNPLTIKTRISFRSTKEQLVEITVKNLIGKTVYGTRINAKIGINSIPFNRDDLTNGMYIYSLQSDTEIVSKRLVIR
ncbi:putative secreted protein (Por secretion system target) [Lutibacter oceani]|uniref:Putative secreted protein (Por secretion system target) n=1 Tax=Lutibacter oceani TaxID=1853311 RepID=A0A3D9RYI7_9FLAO|nr:T9SS type A sorting domain-containing protein [Lutibacter oceani]REE82911.1 putative secreted protein (Por secretion system target) [Lutibacter oceani]